MNVIYLIIPYKHEGTWVFDDATVGIVREPFIKGADLIIDKMVESIPNAEHGFRLLFASRPFLDYNFKLEWLRSENGGDWYYSADYNQDAWVSQVLYRYFPAAPSTIYMKIE